MQHPNGMIEIKQLMIDSTKYTNTKCLICNFEGNSLFIESLEITGLKPKNTISSKINSLISTEKGSANSIGFLKLADCELGNAQLPN